MDRVLSLLEKNAKMSPADIAKSVRMPLAKVKKKIAAYEKDGTIVRYKAVLNRQLIEGDGEFVRALIEVKVSPEKNSGFDHIAERIYRFPEVKSCYLLSGSYDLQLTVEGKNIQTIAHFVSSKLAPLENVQSTVTHFMLTKYKEDGDILKRDEPSKRPKISY